MITIDDYKFALAIPLQFWKLNDTGRVLLLVNHEGLSFSRPPHFEAWSKQNSGEAHRDR